MCSGYCWDFAKVKILEHHHLTNLAVSFDFDSLSLWQIPSVGSRIFLLAVWQNIDEEEVYVIVPNEFTKINITNHLGVSFDFSALWTGLCSGIEVAPAGSKMNLRNICTDTSSANKTATRIRSLNLLMSHRWKCSFRGASTQVGIARRENYKIFLPAISTCKHILLKIPNTNGEMSLNRK